MFVVVNRVLVADGPVERIAEAGALAAVATAQQHDPLGLLRL
jgi:hypothetical protein